MKTIIGVIIVLGCVAGGFIMAHGKLGALWQPNEIIIIFGAAFGSFVIANPMKVVKAGVIGILKLFLPSKKFGKAGYLNLMSLLFEIGTQARRMGLLSLEKEIEAPDQSAIFTKYPEIMKNKRLMEFMIDNIRLITTDNLSKFEFESILDSELSAIEHELDKPGKAWSTVSDALPGFGIVAAVLGIVVTMQFIGGDPKFLGEHVAAALVGTFLGVLLAYGFLAPMSAAMGHQVHDEMQALQCIKIFLLAFVGGSAPKVAIEYVRKSLPSSYKPGFSELDEYIRTR